MVDEILKGIYKIKVPLPIPAVGSMNCYVLADRERSLVVDPGMAHEMCYGAAVTGLEEISIDLERTDFLLTHHHLDHFGLVGRVMKEGSKIYISPTEAQIVEMIASRAILPILSRFLRLMGFPLENPELVLSELLGEEYRALNPWPFRYVQDGSVIEKGGRTFRCILTPGHSPGHICLYEPVSKLLIAGDVFSPVLYFLTDKDNPLRNQLESFNDLSLLDIRMALPGHGDVFTSIKGIIEHFESHHKGRSSQIVEALTNASMDAYEVASRLAKDAQQSGDWESLPHILKYIAARDCFAHLLHLEAAGRVMKKAISGRIVYSPAEDGEHRR